MTLRKRQIPWQTAPLFALCISTTGCMSLAGDCGINVLSNIPNPWKGQNNIYVSSAQIINEDCGATVAWITTVRLIGQDQKPSGFNDGEVFSYYHGQPKIKVTWKDQTHLLIDCPDCLAENVTLKSVKHNGIDVLYAQ